MSYFTPTPWRIGAIEGGMVAVDGANGEEVTGFVFPEDGRLIAAAPDLLAALKDMTDLVQLMCPFDGPQQRKARAAIAKATGEQP